jgi:hypothetical protein
MPPIASFTASLGHNGLSTFCCWPATRAGQGSIVWHARQVTPGGDWSGAGLARVVVHPVGQGGGGEMRMGIAGMAETKGRTAQIEVRAALAGQAGSNSPVTIDGGYVIAGAAVPLQARH